MSWSKKEIPTSQFCNVVNCRIVVWVCKIPSLRNVGYIYMSAGFVFLTTLFDSGWNNFN